MRAMVFERPGPVDVLQLRDIPRPEFGPSEVLIRVKACGLNHLDL
jgi:NADPH2:quinone reductase